MKSPSLSLPLALAAFLLPVSARGEEPPLDFEKARQIFERAKRGEQVTDDEHAYVQRASRARQQAQGNQQPGKGLPAAPPKWTAHLTPLTELGTATYKGEDGGLYGGGKNEPPKAHLDAALRESAKIRALDADGNAMDNGKIGLLSVGMSNTTMEYSRFKQLADTDPAKSPRVVIVDGAQGGQTGLRWADPHSPLWQTVDDRLRNAGLTAKQIQVAWMKQAEAGPTNHGDFPLHAKFLQQNLVQSLANLKERFPNLRIVYLSSRIYAGYATTALNPEPYAYEGAFAMRWLIRDQIAGQPELNFDSARGLVKSPLLLWGPYLWADGETPRKADGLTYKRGDLSDKDGTHPADTARTKVATLLLNFLKTDATARGWFRGSTRAGKVAVPQALPALPEGNDGIAAKHPGDRGIDQDTDVVFHDDFETGKVGDKWSNYYQQHLTSYTTEPANVHAGKRALQFTVPKQQAELSNGVDKELKGYDVVFLRYYSKFDKGFDQIGSSHNGGFLAAQTPDLKYSNPGLVADGKNKFQASFENWRGDASVKSPGLMNVYVYHPAQRSQWGDHFFPNGEISPNTSLPGDFGPHFVPRPQFIPELDRWYCFELMLKANSPGQRDGRIGCWVDGKLIADFPNLRFRDVGTLKIMRASLDLHIHDNVVRENRKWYDDVVVATSYVGPMVL